MCHRLCMTFSLKELQAIIQLHPTSSTIGPNYVELGTKLEPMQTYNASLNSPCPILLSEKHIYDGMTSSAVVLAIMQWGLPPSGDVEGKVSLKQRVTHARKESLIRTKTFEALLKNGHRCVLVCEGFYQFSSLGSRRARQAYFVHLPRLFEARIKRDIMQPCYIAALFDRSKQADGRDLYAFTIITVETPTNLARKLNARMPAMLSRTDDVLAWLDFARVDVDGALQLLDNVCEHLQIDPVSNYVFKKANTGAECLTIVSEQYLEEDASRSPSIMVDTHDSSDIKRSPQHVDDFSRQQDQHHPHERRQSDENGSENSPEALSNRTVKSPDQTPVAKSTDTRVIATELRSDEQSDRRR